MEWVHGNSYVHIVAEHEGRVEAIEKPFKLLILNIRQRINIGGHWQTIWFPPDYGDARADLGTRARLRHGQTYKVGEDVVKLRVKSGDYLFVNRLTYNFRQPQRGEIIVFETRGIDADKRGYPGQPGYIPPDQFYIKRLVALPGETVQISDDNHLIIDGKRLDASTPNFENVYSRQTNHLGEYYLGHLREPHGTMTLFAGGLTNYVPEGRLMVMGDNTESSLDSRYFSRFDAHTVIGKSSFVYWPLTSRFGFGYR
jgi:signal peptidase I